MNRILVIKLRHLGDVLLSAPVFHVLKKKFPAACIDAYIYRESLPMLEGHPAINDFLLTDPSSKGGSLKQELKLLWEIRKRKYDLVINLTEGDRGALAALFSGAPHRIGFDPGSKGLWGKKKIFTHLVKNCKQPRHAVERNLDALRCFGLFPDEEERKLEMHIPEVARERVEILLREKRVEKGFVAIHPVSRWFYKCQRPEQVARLIRALKDRGEEVVLTSGPGAKELKFIEEILTLAGGGATSFAGQLSLKELGALYLQSKALITVDSVPLHMASALKVPVVALFGPTSEENWGPWQNPKARVVTEPMPCRPCFMDGCGGSKRSDCLERLSTEAILRAYDELALEESIL